MQELSWKEIGKFDDICDRELGVRKFLFTIKLSYFSNEDNAQAILGFAEKLGLVPQKLCMYIWFQIYIRELSESFDDIPLLDVVAQKIGVRFNRRFRRYIGHRAEEFQLAVSEALAHEGGE